MLLPAPLRPMMPITSPSAISNDTSSKSPDDVVGLAIAIGAKCVEAPQAAEIVERAADPTQKGGGERIGNLLLQADAVGLGKIADVDYGTCH